MRDLIRKEEHLKAGLNRDNVETPPNWDLLKGGWENGSPIKMPIDKRKRLEEVQEYDDVLIAIESVKGQIEAIHNNAKKLREQSNLGKRFTTRTFDTFDSTKFPEAYRVAQEFAKNFEKNQGKGLLFMGNPGTGKTHLAAAIANYIVDNFGIPVRFINYIDLIEQVKKTFNGHEDIIKTYAETPLLIIDDLTNAEGDWRNEMFYRMVNIRYEANLPIIITTNESFSELEETVMEKTLSRIIEICDAYVMNGEDYRKRGLK